jgi:hypothetical protein
LSLLQSAKLAELNLQNSGYRPQTATNFTFRFAKRFSAKDSKITYLEVLKWLLVMPVRSFWRYQKKGANPFKGFALIQIGGFPICRF